MNIYIDPDINKTDRVFPMEGRASYICLDMNENTEGLPEDFVTEVLSEVSPSFLATYPEPGRFKEAYAGFIGVKPENLMVTNGTDMAIRYILETFGEKGKDVITVSPTFEMYRINCSLLGLNHVPVEYEEDLSLDIDKIISALNVDTRILVLINPNNPVGNPYSNKEAKRIFDRAKDLGIVVVVDEAYHYFYEESLLELAKEYENVLVMRTFSKLMALASLRLGVIIGDPKLIRPLTNSRLTFDVNSLALLFGERLLKRPDIIEAMIKREKEGKAYLLKALDTNGYEYIECKGNYILIKTKSNPHEVTKYLMEQEKILVHDYGNRFLNDYIRVSTASVKVMEKFVEALGRVDR